jgi:serine protease
MALFYPLTTRMSIPHQDKEERSMKIEIGKRPGGLSWLRAGLGAAALAGLVSCAGGVDDQDLSDVKDPGDENGAVPGDETPSKALPYATDTILVRFKRDASLSAQSTLHSQIGTQIAHTYMFLPELQVVSLPEDLSVEKALSLYQGDPSVLYAEPNMIYELDDTTPNDPRFGELFGLHNTGQSGGLVDADIDMIEAWDISQGSPDVVIALLDSGIDFNHPDLNANTFVNLSEQQGQAGVDDDANGYVDDIHGINSVNDTGSPFPFDGDAHGTHVSGTIAASGNNAVGVVGVNWQAKIIGCKAFSPSATLANIIQCMDYFLEMKTRAVNPANIIASNNSWGGGGFSQALLDAIEAHNQAGMLFVAAAGNSNVNTDVTPHFPSTYPSSNIIAVLASDRNDQKASFSSFGARTVDVGAPGHQILSTTPNNTFSVFSGTSMATPHVTGLVALLKAADPARSAAQIKNLILTGGDVTPATDTEVLTGRRINAFGSLTCQDRVLNNRFAPTSNTVVVGTGTVVPLGILSINCDQPNPAAMTVRVAETGQTIPLTDATGSGEFTGQFVPLLIGASTLEFRQGTTVISTVTVNAIGNYDPPRKIPAECRTITGTDIPLGDDTAASVASPFPIQFAGATPGFSSVFVGSNGVLSFSRAVTSLSNTALPNTSVADTLVAALWDDLNPGTSGGGDVLFEVVGAEPNRELVIEYRQISRFSNVRAATFQVVFFENSPNILFNYCDITFEGNPSFSGGASATIGVQVTPQVARQFSFNTASVVDGDAVLFTVGAPIAVAGPDQVVLPGASVTLDGSASQDLDGNVVRHTWTQVAGPPVDLIGADTAVATFTAPGSSTTLTFELEVEDDEAKTSTDRVDVIVNQPPLAEAGADFRVATQLTGSLDCTGSTDSDGIIVGYRWTQLGGDRATIINDGSPVASFVAPDRAQFLVFQCTVTDNNGFTDSDVVVADVFFNAFPLANAGNDRIVRPNSTVAIDATRSIDADGTIASYRWQVGPCMTIAGPCQVTLSDTASATPSFTAPGVSGFVHLQLSVTDNIGATAQDSLTIFFAAQPPAVAATVDPECVSPGDVVTLSSACSDPDGTVVATRWQQIAGAPVTLTGADTNTATFTAPDSAQPLVFEASCTDDDGLTEFAVVSLNVNALPVPVAVCAPVGVLEGQTVTCNATGSQNAVDFTWSSPTNPEVVIPPGATTSFVAPEVTGFAIVDVELAASNACGATATDTVQIVVVSAN